MQHSRLKGLQFSDRKAEALLAGQMTIQWMLSKQGHKLRDIKHSHSRKVEDLMEELTVLSPTTSWVSH